MRSGKLRHVLELQRATETRDAANQVIQQWVTIATIRAHVRPLSGKELLQNDQVEGRVSHEISARFIPDVTPKDRFQWGSRILNIVSSSNVMERGRELQILSIEVL